MKCSKALGCPPALPRVVARPPTDAYVPSEHEMETETDISEPSSKIVRVSEWVAGVAQAIQDHADAMREVSRQRAEQGKSAARATVMAAVIKMGGSVGDYREWVKVLEGGEDDEEEEEDPKGKKRMTGENELEDLRIRHHKKQRVTEREPVEAEPVEVEPEVVAASGSLQEPSVEIGEPSGSKPKKNVSRPVVESSEEEDSEQESEESEAGDYKVKEREDKEKSGTEKSSDD